MVKSRASSRRQVGLTAVLLMMLMGCGKDEGQLVVSGRGSARLYARPAAPKEPSEVKGDVPLTRDGFDYGVLFIPQTYQQGTPAPLVVLLHGAGGSGVKMLDSVRDLAEATNAIVLAPNSVGVSWDLTEGDFGPDVLNINRDLDKVFREYSVDAQRISIAGFSDGASYSLSVGLTNGDLFQRIVAWSPGFVAATELQGKPEVFISHGTQDEVLPIDTGGRFITHLLTRQDYTVDFREFDGPHTVPAEMARAAFSFMTGVALP